MILFHEITILVTLGIIILICLSHVDAFEWLVKFSQEHEAYEIDELVLLVPTLLLIIFLFAILRLRDAIKLNISLHEREKQLNEKQAQLIQSAKLASLGEMATGITHELNQPLTAMGLTAEMLSMELKEAKYKEAAASCTRIKRQLIRACKIVNHMRSYGRDTSREEYQSHNINQIIENAVVLSNMQIKRRTTEILIRLSEKSLPIVCNAIQLEQVFINLLTNAKDALENSKGSIIIRSYQKETWAVSEVEDTGMGMRKEILDKAIDSFFTTKKVGKGTGLGLSISCRIIQEHGGEMKVESEVNRGTVIKVKLPIVQ